MKKPTKMRLLRECAEAGGLQTIEQRHGNSLSYNSVRALLGSTFDIHDQSCYK